MRLYTSRVLEDMKDRDARDSDRERRRLCRPTTPLARHHRARCRCQAFAAALDFVERQLRSATGIRPALPSDHAGRGLPPPRPNPSAVRLALPLFPSAGPASAQGQKRETQWPSQPRPNHEPAKESFAALLDESLRRGDSLEGTVVKGTRRWRSRTTSPLIDVGLKSEGRVPLKEFAAAGPARRDQGRATRSRSSRAHGGQERRGACSRARRPGARKPGRGSRRAFQKQRARHRRHLRPRQGRLHRRPQRRRGLPAGQPGRYPPGARHHPAARHAAAVPDPEDGPLARQHRRLAPRRARREPRRGALRAGRQPQGRPDSAGRGQEHHRLRRLRRSGRRRRPAARHRHRLAPHQPSRPRRCISARPSRCRSSASTPRPSASASA